MKRGKGSQSLSCLETHWVLSLEVVYWLHNTLFVFQSIYALNNQTFFRSFRSSFHRRTTKRITSVLNFSSQSSLGSIWRRTSQISSGSRLSMSWLNTHCLWCSWNTWHFSPSLFVFLFSLSNTHNIAYEGSQCWFYFKNWNK
jgi:hypothetical protein